MSLGVQHFSKKNLTEVKSRETFSDSNVYIGDKKTINQLNRDFQNENLIQHQNTLDPSIKQTQLEQKEIPNRIPVSASAASTPVCTIFPTTISAPAIYAPNKHTHRHSKSLHLFPKSSFHPISPLALSDYENSRSVNRQSVAKNFGKKKDILTEKISKSFDENSHCPLDPGLDRDTDFLLPKLDFIDEFLIKSSKQKTVAKDTFIDSSSCDNTSGNNHFTQQFISSNTTSSQYSHNSQLKTLLNDPCELNEALSLLSFTTSFFHQTPTQPTNTLSGLFSTDNSFLTNSCQTSSTAISTDSSLQNLRQSAQLLKGHTRCHNNNDVDFKSIYEESDDEEYFDKDDDDKLVFQFNTNSFFIINLAFII